MIIISARPICMGLFLQNKNKVRYLPLFMQALILSFQRSTFSSELVGRTRHFERLPGYPGEEREILNAIRPSNTKSSVYDFSKRHGQAKYKSYQVVNLSLNKKNIDVGFFVVDFFRLEKMTHLNSEILNINCTNKEHFVNNLYIAYRHLIICYTT